MYIKIVIKELIFSKVNLILSQVPPHMNSKWGHPRERESCETNTLLVKISIPYLFFLISLYFLCYCSKLLY